MAYYELESKDMNIVLHMLTMVNPVYLLPLVWLK